jgi:Bacterial Ig-like domain (group 1)
MNRACLRSLACTALATLLGAGASAETFNAAARGWYNQNGLHNATNLNTLVGQGTTTDRFRAFFVFDLAGMTQPAGSGVLRLELEAYLGPDPMEHVAIYDVSTPPAEIVLSQTGRTDIYADLGGDVLYGALLVSPSDVGTVIEFPLSPEAIAAINLARGGRFAIGASVETLRLARGSEGVRFSLAGESRVHQLVLDDAPASLSMTPALAFLTPPAAHALTALVVDGGGAPLPGATVDFSVTSGPHAGLQQSVASDAAGAASFTYPGSGSGVDHILATLADGSASPSQSEATAFWDADCNANGVPDTCDLACDGWNGACSAFAACGGSLDENASGAPDECDPPPPASNAPPECSAAAASPALMPRADHRFREVAVGGVSDPDGDPVQVVVDAVFQDEPVLPLGPHSPDALGVGGGDRVQLRAESREHGDGRVYHLAFYAEDASGGSCSGEVMVCVPSGGRRSNTCVDQGPLHDSTQVDSRRRGHGWWWWRLYHHHKHHKRH